MGKINYSTIRDLGFHEEKCNDKVYLKQYGYDYVIYSYGLTRKLTVYWRRESETCTLERINNLRECRVLNRHDVKTEKELRMIIDFFKDPKNES